VLFFIPTIVISILAPIAHANMSVEDKFNAAVNVIRNLPKNGSYQPSNEMMLRFYSLFKQATIGPCNEKRPSFFNVVNRAKWESWNSLGNMPKEKAMQKYVDALKEIVETMSFTENVANFMGSISELDNIDVNDLELVAPEAIKHARSRPGSPFASKDPSPTRIPNGMVNGHMTESDDEYNSADETELPNQRRYYHTSHQHSDPVLRQLHATSDAMTSDLQSLASRFAALEKNVIDMKQRQIAYRKYYPKWWPLRDVHPLLLFLVFVWPIVVNRFMQKRRK